MAIHNKEYERQKIISWKFLDNKIVVGVNRYKKSYKENIIDEYHPDNERINIELFVRDEKDIEEMSKIDPRSYLYKRLLNEVKELFNDEVEKPKKGRKKNVNK